ncbi:MAG: hypothetical protein CM15mP95_2040 [Alphaproteobacteria bacterium]|nr:MAG: hypothetical protein CM15mP95_2040 [Alphaproteobacteria bacterium]
MTLTTEYQDLGGVDLAIEAVFEERPCQKRLAIPEAVLRSDVVIATNTSSYLKCRRSTAGVLADPSRLVGLHFFAPVSYHEASRNHQRRDGITKSISYGGMQLQKPRQNSSRCWCM